MRLDLAELASKRIHQFLTEAVRYWQLIGQSGLSLSVIILFILGLVYYEQLIAGIPEWWPMGLTYSIIFSWLCFRAPQRHFLQEADLVFLTPLEREMTNYFNRTCMYNLSVQMGAVVVCLILLYPVYRDLVQGPHQPSWAYFLIPVILKGWNYLAHWSVLKLTEERMQRAHQISRLLFTFGLLLWWFEEGPWWLLIVFGGVGVAFIILDWDLTKDQRCPWLVLLELEKRQQSRFYSFCQSFVDVPHISPQINKRAWLNWLAFWLPFKQEAAFRYLYLKTWMRSKDSFGIYVRLTLLGFFGVLLLEDVWGQGLLYGLVLFTTAVQLRGIGLVHGHHFWSQLFPIREEVRQQSKLWLLQRLLMVQAALMMVAFPLSGVSLNTTLLIFFVALASCWLYFSWQKKEAISRPVTK
jgi:ABC-2 type transport system permease protein